VRQLRTESNFVYVCVCLCNDLAKDISRALNSEFPTELTIVCPGTVCYLHQHDILCIRCKVKFYILSLQLPMLSQRMLPSFVNNCVKID